MVVKQNFEVVLSDPAYGGGRAKIFKTDDGKIFTVPCGLECEVGDRICVIGAGEIGHDGQSPVVTEFSTGAKRGTDHADCDLSLIPPSAMRSWGRAFAEGRKKYGVHNWLKGFPQMTVINHALQHIFSYLDGDKSEDHLGHALWNIGTAIHQDVYRPDLLDLPPYQESATHAVQVND